MTDQELAAEMDRLREEEYESLDGSRKASRDKVKNPTPEEIRQACREIQEEWSEYDEWCKRTGLITERSVSGGGETQITPYTIPQVRLAQH